MNKKLITILVGVVALVGVFVFVVDRKSEVTPTKEVSIKTEKIEGWQTYRNEELGFEVQYPEGWFVKDYRINNPRNSPSIGFDPWESNPGGTVWDVRRRDGDGETASEQLTEILITPTDERYVVEKKEIVYGGYPAVKVVSKHIESAVTALAIVIPSGKYIYTIRAEDYTNIDPEKMSWPYNKKLTLLKQLGNEYPEIFLNSFRFID